MKTSSQAIVLDRAGSLWTGFAVILISSAVLLSSANGGVFPDVGYKPPQGWTGQRFELSQDYPKTSPTPESLPWAKIDFKTKPAEYMQAVLDYAYEGNEECEFVVQNNKVRKWYHAPWLHAGRNPREFVRGLTRERGLDAYELAETQTKPVRNVAVSAYNPMGGFRIGTVWQDPKNPNTKKVLFDEGSVSFKLLFTTATETAVPYLKSSPEWMADINRSPDPAEIEKTKVRLLQVDIAVRDKRSSEAGWVFGTFQYDASNPATSAWRRLTPVALMWGNDETLTQTDYDAGKRPTESWINSNAPSVKYRSGLDPPTMGWAGRANGPVDNPVSSCLSCHSTGQIPAKSPIVPKDSLSEKEKLKWFRNLKIGEPFDKGSDSMDFSLQLAVGVQNFQQFRLLTDDMGGIHGDAPSAFDFFLEQGEVPSKRWKRAYPQQFRIERGPDEPVEPVKKDRETAQAIVRRINTWAACDIGADPGAVKATTAKNLPKDAKSVAALLDKSHASVIRELDTNEQLKHEVANPKFDPCETCLYTFYGKDKDTNPESIATMKAVREYFAGRQMEVLRGRGRDDGEFPFAFDWIVALDAKEGHLFSFIFNLKD